MVHRHLTKEIQSYPLTSILLMFVGIILITVALLLSYLNIVASLALIIFCYLIIMRGVSIVKMKGEYIRIISLDIFNASATTLLKSIISIKSIQEWRQGNDGAGEGYGLFFTLKRGYEMTYRKIDGAEKTVYLSFESRKTEKAIVSILSGYSRKNT